MLKVTGADAVTCTIDTYYRLLKYKKDDQILDKSTNGSLCIR